MIRVFFLLTTILFTLSVNAQTSDDVLRYSRLDFGGTARTMGIGGGIGALGADFAVMSTNPAGLAAYRSSELMFTSAFKFIDVSSKLEGSGNEAVSENTNKFLLDNIGYVMASQPMASSWAAVNLAIGMNKLANFNREFYYEGISQGSIVNRFTEQASGVFSDELYPFEEGLAFQTEAIFGPDADGNYGSDFQDAPNADVQRRQRVRTSGSINELLLALAGNYQHKLMIGVTFGFPIVKFSESRSYTEENNEAQTIPNFNDLTFTEELNTTGTGFNMKLGMIYRASQAVRIGLAVHTPTAFKLTDTWGNSMNYDFTFEDERFDNDAEERDGGPFEYKIKTPLRAIGSVGVIFQKRGFLTAELEFVDYSQSSLDLTVNSTDTETELYERSLNEEISERFDNAINFKLGGELAHEIFRMRAGYGIFGTSYADKSSFDTAYSLGLGIREKKFYLDLAYRHSQFEENFTPYRLIDPANEQQITNESSINKFILTLGFRF